MIESCFYECGLPIHNNDTDEVLEVITSPYSETGSIRSLVTNLVYISGPYRDLRGEYYVRENIKEAEAVAAELWQLGFAVICPHKNTGGLGGIVRDDRFLAGDLMMIEKCDLIVMLPGWKGSSGSRMELKHAYEHGIHVYHWPDHLPMLRKMVGR